MTKYERLFSPLKIGTLTVKNRYALGPMGGRFYIYGPKGEYSNNGVDYYSSRARGGFGLIITGSNVADLTVDPFDPINGNPNPLYARAVFAHGARETLMRVHAYGAKMFLQISMGPGRMRDGKSCSRIPKYKSPDKLTEEMTTAEIETKIKAMADMAVFAKNCGYDGVEIHGMHWGYLLEQFTMAYTNHRTDEYGGDLDGRLNIVRKIILAIKDACGAEYPVSLRMDIKTYMGGFNKTDLTGEHDVGRTIEESVEIARRLESYGLDMLNVNTGTYDTFYYCVAPYYMPRGYNIALAAQVKHAVNIPVFVAGKMDDPEMCEAAIERGDIDGVTLARASLADGDYVKKVFAGCEEDIRPCISCTNCIDTTLACGAPLCSVNPAAMNEYNYGIVPASEKKRVLVVGGGVAGMEAARVLSLRGHKVELCEASDSLGGHLIEAGSHPFKDGIAKLNRWYQRRLYELGVSIKLGVRLNTEDIIRIAPDAVVLAVGSDHFMPKIPGIDSSKVVSCYDALMHNRELGSRVVVVGGGMTGCELAYDLAALEGKNVVLVEALNEIMSTGAPVPRSVRMMLIDLLNLNRVKLLTGRRIVAVDEVGAVIEVQSGSRSTIPADSVVIAIGLRPGHNMSSELQGYGFDVYTVGDGKAVGNIRSCVSEAYEIAKNI